MLLTWSDILGAPWQKEPDLTAIEVMIESWVCVRNEGLLVSLLVTSVTVPVSAGREAPLWNMAYPCLLNLLFNSVMDFTIVVIGRCRDTQVSLQQCVIWRAEAKGTGTERVSFEESDLGRTATLRQRHINLRLLWGIRPEVLEDSEP